MSRYVLRGAQDGGAKTHDELVYEMSNSEFTDLIRDQSLTTNDYSMIGSNNEYYIFEVKNLKDEDMIPNRTKTRMSFNDISADYVYLCITTGSIEQQKNALPSIETMDQLTSIVKQEGSSIFSVCFSLKANDTDDATCIAKWLRNQKDQLKYHMNIHYVENPKSFPDWKNLKIQYPVEYKIIESCKTVIITNFNDYSSDLDPTLNSNLHNFYLSNGDDALNNPILQKPMLFFPFLKNNPILREEQFDHATFLSPFITNKELRTLHMTALQPIDYKEFENFHDEYFNAVFFNESFSSNNPIETTKKIIDQLSEKLKDIMPYAAYHAWCLDILKISLGKKVLESKYIIDSILFKDNRDTLENFLEKRKFSLIKNYRDKFICSLINIDESIQRFEKIFFKPKFKTVRSYTLDDIMQICSTLEQNSSNE